ncbi:MAG: PsbP-related protein [Flavobacteriales bacterium]
MNKKTTILITILLVVAGLVIVSDNIVKKNDSGKVNNSTSTLSTYVNEKYGFSFKYPENVTVYEKGDKELDPPSEDPIIV